MSNNSNFARVRSLTSDERFALSREFPIAHYLMHQLIDLGYPDSADRLIKELEDRYGEHVIQAQLSAAS